MSLESSFAAFEDVAGSWMVIGILTLIWNWSMVFDTLMFRNLYFYLCFEGAKNIYLLFPDLRLWRMQKVPDWGLGILILIFMWLLVFDTIIFQFLALYLDFEGTINIYVLCVIIWGFRGGWRFLTGVWHLDLDLDMVTDLWYTHILIFGSLYWFWRYKKHSSPSSSDLGLWRTLKVPDWVLSSQCLIKDWFLTELDVLCTSKSRYSAKIWIICVS